MVEALSTEHGTVRAVLQHGYKAGEARSGRCEVSRLAASDALLPLAELQRRPLPDHVHPHHLERHLASPDFIVSTPHLAHLAHLPHLPAPPRTSPHLTAAQLRQVDKREKKDISCEKKI